MRKDDAGCLCLHLQGGGEVDWVKAQVLWTLTTWASSLVSKVQVHFRYWRMLMLIDFALDTGDNAIGWYKHCNTWYISYCSFLIHTLSCEWPTYLSCEWPTSYLSCEWPTYHMRHHMNDTSRTHMHTQWHEQILLAIALLDASNDLLTKEGLGILHGDIKM